MSLRSAFFNFICLTGFTGFIGFFNACGERPLAEGPVILIILRASA
jgi:hypothetical protein